MTGPAPQDRHDPFQSPRDGGGDDDALPLRPRDPDEPDGQEEDRPYDPPSLVPNDTSRQFRDLEAPEVDDEHEYELDAEPEPLPPPPPIPTRKTPSPSRIIREDGSPDRPCRQCGYNLFGLPVEGKCPECGEPIAASRKTSLIRDANPVWSKKVSIGAKLIVAGFIGRFFANFVLGVLTLGSTSQAENVISAIIGIAGTTAIIVGVWFLTMRDPSGRGEDSYGTMRQVARIGLCISGASNLILAGFAAGIVPANAEIPLAATVLLAELIGIVGVFALLKYVGKLAARLPNPYLQDRADLVFWGFGLSAGTLAILGFAMAVAAMTSPQGFAVLGCLGVITAIVVGIAFVVFAIMYLLLLGGLAAEFDLARKEGEKQAMLLRSGNLAGPRKPRAKPIDPGPTGPPQPMRL